jgi:putative ABC transport system permease protein
VLLSVTLTPTIVSMAEGFVPRADEIAVDWSVLAFAFAAAVVAGVLSSLAPLWQALRTRPADILGDGVRTSASRRNRGASHSLIIAEIALAFVLVAAGSVLVAHVRALSRLSPGFDADGVLTFAVSIPGHVAADPDQRIPLQRRLVEAIDAIPGVEDAAFAQLLPMKGCCWPANVIPDNGRVASNPSSRTSLMAVSEGYFRTMRIPLKSGQLFSEALGTEELEPIPVVVSESLVKLYWPDQNPVGAFGRFDRPDGPRFTVVGVVADVKNAGLDNESVPEIYRPAAGAPIETMRFVVRSSRADTSLIADVRRQIQNLDPTQPVHDVELMHAVVQRTMTLERTVSLMTAFFAGAALLLAMVGVYGVVSYSVRQRTVEIGMRMALGATHRTVFSMVVGSGLKLAAVGVVIGGVAAIAAVSYLGSVFRLGDPDYAPYAYSTGIVVVVAFAASFIPAWRATLLSPLVAIRNRL